MGGTAVAARLITGKEIKNASITGVDIKNKSLTARDFRGSVVGPTGPVGPPGAPGLAGNGALVEDANGALIGQLIDDPSVASLGGPTVLTPGGYALTLDWNGGLPPRPSFIPYAEPNCQGPAYLGTGAGSSTVTTSTKRLLYESSPGTFQVPAKPTSSVIGIGSYEEGTNCSNINSLTYAWPLKAVSRAATGLPATIAGPIDLATG